MAAISRPDFRRTAAADLRALISDRASPRQEEVIVTAANILEEIADAADRIGASGGVPVPMRLTCPECGELHIDEGEFATKPHHTHSCQSCGLTWRPAVVATVGVRFLPGFKNEVR